MKKYFLPALRMLFALTLLTGIIYPLAITFVAQTFFPNQANGSVIEKNGKIIGSKLIAQNFTDEKYFHPRPSAVKYNPLPSGGTNLGPTSKQRADSAQARRKKFIQENFLADSAVVPYEMLFASASGVDPHISLESAKLQIMRVAKARGVDKKIILSLIEKYSELQQWNLFGMPRVNVLQLNLALDEIHQ